MVFKGLKASSLSILILIPIVILLENYILAPHLRYSFADVDWNFLLSFKELSKLYHSPINHIINGWKIWGVYTYQLYYIGLIENVFGMDYRNFQIATHIFKIIATLSIYPVILLVTKSRLAAFLTTIIYAFAYSSIGVMYTVVTSGLFVAIPFMSIFFIWYWYLLKKGKNSFWEIIIWEFLFFITLLLATERMYPLIPTVILIELFWWFKNNFSKVVFYHGLKRLAPFIVLFLGIILYKPSIFIEMSGNVSITYQKFMLGNWQVFLSPLISLGGLFLPKDYWRILGEPNINGISSYVVFLLSGPFVIFFCLSILLSLFLSNKPIKFLFNTLSITFVLGLLIYVLSTHHLTIPESVRMHFDFGYIIPALLGSYIISVTLFSYKEWLNDGKKNDLLISMIGGITLAFLFIITTWIAADWVLVFFGVHRYLTIPSIGSSLFIACFIVIIFNKIKTIRSIRFLSYLIFLVLIPLFLFNAKVIKDYFQYELEYAGTDAAGHTRMKNKLWSYLGGISKTEPSIFYFDESQDHDNGYFDETTIMAGFTSWMRFRGSDIVPKELTPGLLRSNLMCVQDRSMCLSKVKELTTQRDGEKGILYGDIFYKTKNFYAFRFIDKDIVDITPEIVRAIGLD